MHTQAGVWEVLEAVQEVPGVWQRCQHQTEAGGVGEIHGRHQHPESQGTGQGRGNTEVKVISQWQDI